MLKQYIYINNFQVSIFIKSNFLYIYIYNENYFVLIKLFKKIKLKLKNQKCLELTYIGSNIKSICYISYITKFLNQFYICEYSKIKFSGKGYKIKKNHTQSLILLFNRSHLTMIWWKNIFLKKYKKYKIYIKYNLKNKNFLKTILNIRYINIFTKKGLRESKQILLKKKGKK